MPKTWIVAGALALMIGAPAAAGEEKGFERLSPDDFTWQELRPGLSVALVGGDPATEGFYVIRARFRPGTFSAPHYHQNDRIVTVVKGTWWTGIGPVLDKASSVPLTPGSVMKHPAGGIHYDGAKDEEVIVQIAGLGPAELIYVDEEGNPIEQ